jgi:UDPglucose 6-dehydrogenase
MINKEKILLVGLGKLGLPLLSTFGKNGQKIIGIDIDKEKINLLKTGKVPFFEPKLESYINLGFDNVTYDENFEERLSNVDVSIILVNTPSNSNGEFSNQYIFDAIEEISKNLQKLNKKDFLFIISSTVMPGTHLEIIEKIESISGKKLNEDFGVVYIPDLVALGNVITDFENPDLVILGESSKKYGDIAEEIYSKIYKNNPPIVRMSLIESEISKVSLNAYITMKISFANFIGNICEKFGTTSKNVTQALGYDRRISPYYIKSGLAFGGTCFPRDTWAFIKMSENLGLDAKHIKATQKINEEQNNLLFNKVSNFKNKTVGIIGLSFKPNTSVTTESPGYILYEKLKNLNYNLVVFDELVEVGESKSLNEVIELSDIIVVTHNDKNLEIIKNINIQNKPIINPWGLNI